MKQFTKKVDMRSRKAMTDFLSRHFRYWTGNSWNRSSSYAQDLKIYNIGLTKEQEDRLFEILDVPGVYDPVSDLCEDFGRDHNWLWQAAFNGRSGGYLVLYQGGTKPTEYRSFCTSCGQRNYKPATQDDCTCGRCRKQTRVNYSTPPIQIYSSMCGTDEDEDFSDWSMEDLRARVRLVCDFDSLCDAVVREAAYIADHAQVEEEEVLVSKTRKYLVFE